MRSATIWSPCFERIWPPILNRLNKLSHPIADDRTQTEAETPDGLCFTLCSISLTWCMFIFYSAPDWSWAGYGAKAITDSNRP